MSRRLADRELHTLDERQAKLARRMGLVVHGPGA